MDGSTFRAFGVLGPLLPCNITPPAQRRLLSILLLGRGLDLDRDVLFERMWGHDPPRSARNALHVHISRLRTAVPDGIIATTTYGYRIDLGDDGFDVAEFDRLTDSAHREVDTSQRLRTIKRALRLWRDDPYQELIGDTFALPEIVRLKEQRLELLALHMQALLDLGRYKEAIPRLRELVERFPLRERLHENLMLALYRAGRQADALRQFQTARRVLGEQVGIEPGPALRELEERILFQTPDLGVVETRQTPHNLPAFTTSFVGREKDLASTTEALRAGRVVSIVGAPGIGKTRLAVELGYGSLDEYPGGIWLVSLSDARTGEDVAALIAAAALDRQSVSGLANLAIAWAPRPALLILDNCERVLDSCSAFAVEVLATGGELRILVASRSRLGIDGERVRQLEPLPVPAGSTGEMGLSEVTANISVRLFIDRARAVDRTFTLSAGSVAAIIDLTNRLAGIPRLIESAALSISAMGVGEIASSFRSTNSEVSDSGSDDAALSFRSSIEASLSLLVCEDRALVDDIAVFNGWFGISDVEAVCAGGRGRVQLAGSISRIVESSLLLTARGNDGLTRYRLLAPIREALITARRPCYGDVEEMYVRHYLSRVLTRRSHQFARATEPTLVDEDVDDPDRSVRVYRDHRRAAGAPV